MKLNVKLLKKARAAILRNPREFDMDFYLADLKNAFPWSITRGKSWKHHTSRCGTAGCIAGHVWCIVKSLTIKQAVQLKGSSAQPGASITTDVRREAIEALGLSPAQTWRLFNLSGWPVRFQTAYDNTKSASKRARIAAERIDFFITTKGRDYVICSSRKESVS